MNHLFIPQLATALLILSAFTLRAAEPDKPPSVAEIIKSIRENEALYDDIELELDETYKLENGAIQSTEVISNKKLIRLVFRGQSQFRRVDQSAKIMDDEGQKVRDVRFVDTYVSDGKSMRQLHKEDDTLFADIVLDQGLTRGNFRAHLFLMHGQFPCVNEALSAILESKILDPGWPVPNPTHIVVEEVKLETLDGLACIKLACKTTIDHPTGGPYSAFLTLWLAKDRNYLPIRLTLVHPANHPTLPSVSSTASNLREISPGVWFPFRVGVDVFSRDELKEGKAVRRLEYALNFKKVAYKPKYEADFFTDLPFPKGTTVRVIADKREVMRYIQGDTAKPKENGDNKK